MQATDTTETNCFVWPRRWYPLRTHREQDRLRDSAARFKIVPAGRRSGKTEFAKRHLVYTACRDLIHPKPWDDARYFAAAPTRDQAKRIWWLDLKKLTPSDAIASISESELCIRTVWGSELWVVGLDKAERIEGVSWDGGVIDELASCKPGIFDANIRPALSDRLGWLWLIGVPDMDSPGQVEYKRMVEMARAGADPEWDCFTWPSADILPASEVESARRRMDPRMFEQEYEGKFILAGGLAFPTFDYRTHVIDAEAAYDPALPLCWSLDFNVNPMASGVVQHRKGGKVRVIREFLLADSSTDVACEAFLDWVERDKINTSNLHVYGDATGNARDSTSGRSDWTIVANRLKNLRPTFHVPASNPAIKDTVNAVRAKLKNAAGEVGLAIHSDCRQLVKDFQEALWPSDIEPQHSLAWLRYFIAHEYPVVSTRTGSARFAIAN